MPERTSLATAPYRASGRRPMAGRTLVRRASLRTRRNRRPCRNEFRSEHVEKLAGDIGLRSGDPPAGAARPDEDDPGVGRADRGTVVRHNPVEPVLLEGPPSLGLEGRRLPTGFELEPHEAVRGRHGTPKLGKDLRSRPELQPKDVGP